MNKPLLVTLLAVSVFIASLVYSQAGKTSGTAYQYCEFVWTHDWGEYNGPKYGKIYFGNGKSESYNKSIYDGLNYLGAKGWELCTAYIEDNEGSRSYSYTFKKKL